MFNKPRILFLPALLSIAAFGCSDQQVSAPEATLADRGAVLETAARPGQTIAEIAMGFSEAANPEFTVLVAALTELDLVGKFSGPGQNTVFAPTDAAFGRLLNKLNMSAADLLANKPLLEAVLLYHVAPGRRMSEDVLESDRIRTLSKGFVYPMINSSGAFIVDNNSMTSDAQLLAPDLIDVEASNGVIHVISEVLLPDLPN
jgi:uncharacterized surface protein with fasciclin (FAS1) repeats